MKHHAAIRKLGRERNQRRALLRHLARALVLEENIETTLAKAKELRPFIERLVTLARRGGVAERRRVAREMGGESVAVKKLFAEIAPRFSSRNGGYVRIVRTRIRTSDSAIMARILFVE